MTASTRRFWFRRRSTVSDDQADDQADDEPDDQPDEKA
jgi:hypothetical protein